MVLFSDLDDEKGIGSKCRKRHEHRASALGKKIFGQEWWDFGACALKKINASCCSRSKFCICTAFVPASSVGASRLQRRSREYKAWPNQGFSISVFTDCLISKTPKTAHCCAASLDAGITLAIGVTLYWRVVKITFAASVDCLFTWETGRQHCPCEVRGCPHPISGELLFSANTLYGEESRFVRQYCRWCAK